MRDTGCKIRDEGIAHRSFFNSQSFYEAEVRDTRGKMQDASYQMRGTQFGIPDACAFTITGYTIPRAMYGRLIE